MLCIGIDCDEVFPGILLGNGATVKKKASYLTVLLGNKATVKKKASYHTVLLGNGDTV